MTRPAPLLLLILAWSLAPPPAYAHGTERPFGTPINGRGAAPATGRSAAFTLLALTANLNGLERDLREGRTAEVRETARRLPAMARELVAHSADLDLPEHGQVEASARFISERADQIDLAVARLEPELVLRELNLVRERVAALEDLLHDAKE